MEIQVSEISLMETVGIRILVGGGGLSTGIEPSLGRKLLIYINRNDISNLISGQFEPTSKRPAMLELH